MFFRSPPSMDAVPSVKDSLQDQHCGVRRTVGGGGDSRQRSVGLNTEGTLSISVSHWHLRSLAYPFFLVIFWPPKPGRSPHCGVFNHWVHAAQDLMVKALMWSSIAMIRPTNQHWIMVLGCLGAAHTQGSSARLHVQRSRYQVCRKKCCCPDVYGMVNLSKNWKLLVFLIFPSWSLLPKKTSKNNNNILIHIKQT